jgi:spermidine/putrescine transport system ATP-binding protein
VLDGVDMSHIPPHKRKVNTVFQSYALFPFLSVEDNVAFGLRYKGLSRQEARSNVREALALVRMDGMEKRRPAQLSGGQQQRVALARALVLNPTVLLLDEPLGALDAKLRKALQIELKALQEEVGVTFIYVTHDQEEALTMSDRIAVMSNGSIEQVGSPSEVYEEPATAWVADFLGVSNLMEGRADGHAAGGACLVRVSEFELKAEQGELNATGPVKVVIRPERVVIEPYGTSDENSIPGMVERLVYMGPTMQLIVRLAAGVSLQVMIPNRGDANPFPQGTPVSVQLPADALRVLPSGEAATPATDEEADRGQPATTS